MQDIMYSVTVLAKSASSPVISQPRNEETKVREEEKKKFKQTSQTSTSMVPADKFPLKSCLRDKSHSQGITPRVFKKLRFNLPTNQSLTNVLQSLDKNQSLFTEGLEIKNVDCIKMRKVTCQEEQESHGGKPMLQMQSSSTNGTSVSQSCDEHFKMESDEYNGNKCSSKNGSYNKDGQELFSDDEDEGQSVLKCHDVGQQIKKIQQFLNNERLTTSRKRKFPADDIQLP